MSSNGYSVVPVQKAFMALRIVQVVFSIIVLGMAAYVVSLTSGYGSAYVFEPGALGIFTVIATWIFVAYWFFANSASGQKLYNYWAIFAVEFFVWVFWLTTFALYASYASRMLSVGDSSSSSNSNSNSGHGEFCYSGYCASYKRGLTKRYYAVDTVSATIYTALALSVVNFILFSVTLTLYTINMFRHRTTFSTVESVRQPQAQAVPIPAHKVEMA